MKSIAAGIAVVVLLIAGFFLGATPQVPVELHQSEGFVTHISTDKPIYRTGEKLYVRGVILRADGHTPLVGPQSTTGAASFEIKGPKGDTVASGMSAIIYSVVGFSWDIPASQAGGEYTIRVSLPGDGEPAERKFDIRAYRAPRLKSQIVFVRDGYGPGDTVAANLHVERAEGGIPAGARVSVSARIDGQETWNGSTTVDSSGNANATFKLPAAIAHGEGVIAMTIQDGGTLETATKTIPILLHAIDLAMYPEGGDLVAGLTNRVYIEGHTAAKKPADMAGIIVNGAGAKVATFRTEHEGRGRFSFVPTRGETYSLRITEPAGIQTLYPLPPVKESGVVISSLSDITSRDEDVVVRVAGTVDGNYGVALSQRGKDLSFKRITLRANQPATVAFTVPQSLDGVIVATVYDDRKTPRAERLLFRQPQHRLKVKIDADHKEYAPGDKVTLRITTTDEDGKPAGAMVGLTVTDSSILEMIEKREQAPNLPVMVLLENEVKDLADAQVYLNESNPKAPLATDLLLGTQGWRRFATSGTGSLTGTVTDGRNAVMPGVTVRAVNTFTGSVFTAVTDERGAYVFPNVNAGMYRLNTSLPGFQQEAVSGLLVPFNSSKRQDFRLQVGTMMEMAAVGGIRKAMPMPAAAPAPVMAMNAMNLKEDKPRDQKLQAADEEFDRLDFLQNAKLKDVAGRAEAREANVNIVTVREYAHSLRPGWSADSRVDFSETVYWNAGVRTDSNTGAATVSFNLSDSVTSFRVLGDAFASDGTLGSTTGEVESVKPFSIEPKIPLQVTSGDVIELPISMINGVSRELQRPEFTVKVPAGISVKMLGDNLPVLRAKERVRRTVQLTVDSGFKGMADLTLDAKAGLYRDSVGRTIDVQASGFPREISKGGMLDRNGTQSFDFVLPADFVRGSVSSSVTLYPTPLANMTDALQSLLREPNGCFEQTSSTSYPMVMAQQYFLTHTGVDGALIEKAKSLLDVSYKRLTGFETKTNGYEWFGADPGHEALTAYGLMQFTDMSKVRAVDKEMLNRTRAWLLARRDGKGGFNRNPRALDSFGGAPADTTNAYILWTLIESGEKGLDKEIASVKVSAGSSADSYIIALSANILHATGDVAGARQLMDKLAKNQEPAGNVKGAVTSITRSGGDALTIETTALSVLAWMQEPSYASNVEKGLKWVAESNKSGRFGSTQSTILALRAVVAYDAAHARPKAPGRAVLVVDGKSVGSPLAFSANTQGALVLPEFAAELAPGKHVVALRMEDGSSMPYAISVKYHSLVPESSAEAQVGIRVELKDSQIREGAVTEAMVSIQNKSDQVIPTPVAIVGIPGGLEVRHDQLKELVKAGRIDAYEVIGREVVLYWRHLKANEKFDLPLSLVASIPGSYTGPASRAYLYYTDEYKTWAPALKVTIK